VGSGLVKREDIGEDVGLVVELAGDAATEFGGGWIGRPVSEIEVGYGAIGEDGSGFEYEGGTLGAGDVPGKDELVPSDVGAQIWGGPDGLV
jgi:hypothetical protein